MEKNFGQSGKLQPYTDLSVIREGFINDENAFYVQPQHALWRIVDIERITTPLIGLPLNIRLNRIVKRSFDIVFSIVIIVGVLSWLMPVIAILICINSRGPVFFLQKRNKKNGELFTCIKFRSMIVNAEADILPAGSNDKRITRVGRFLRDYYLDELPQFFNVLAGDMSVIGPRPHMVSDNLKYEEQVEHYACRHKIKPGITGLAQVLGYTGAAEDVQKMKERVSMDIFYQRHWSVKLDIIIMWKTVLKAFRL
jgi:putative colanic acid biosynthesis UDP-glucose lipid carrier transferase